MRQIVLDTETTGLDTASNHRIIEIGCVELINRKLTGKHFHCYLNPHREVDKEALEVHGLSNDFLADKPTFDQIVDEFIDYVRDSELIIHNAPFDIGFLDHELSKLSNSYGRMRDYCTVEDTLVMARQRFPGQRVTLDALCKRFGVDNSSRQLHGALLDSEILADVYLLMTGGQQSLLDSGDENEKNANSASKSGGIQLITGRKKQGRVIFADHDELQAHNERLDSLAKSCGDKVLWRTLGH